MKKAITIVKAYLAGTQRFYFGAGKHHARIITAFYKIIM